MVERHAQTPELGDAVQLDAAETLEGDPGDDALDSGYVPPDRPSRLSREGLTAAEQIEGESLEDKLAQEQGTDEPADADRAGRLRADDDGTGAAPVDGLAGTDVGIDGGAASAEEAAVHRIDDTTY